MNIYCRIRLLGLGLGLARINDDGNINRSQSKRFETQPDPHNEAILRSMRSDPGLKATRSLQDDAIFPKDALRSSLYEEAFLRHMRSLPEDGYSRPLRSSVHEASLMRSLRSPANEDIHGNGILRSVRSIHDKSLLRSLRSAPGKNRPVRSPHQDALMRSLRSVHGDALMRSLRSEVSPEEDPAVRKQRSVLDDAVLRSLRSVHDDALMRSL